MIPHRSVISSDAARPLGGRAAESRDLVVLKQSYLLKRKHKVPRLCVISASLKSRFARDDRVAVTEDHAALGDDSIVVSRRVPRPYYKLPVAECRNTTQMYGDATRTITSRYLGGNF